MTASSPTKKWRDAFVLELRLRGADGKQIGDELAQVASHCSDAGTGVEEAFGDPVAYARSVVVADDGSPTLSAGEGRRIVMRTLVQTVGLMILLQSVLALRAGRPVTFTGGEVINVLVLAALLVLLVTRADAVLNFLARRSFVVVFAWAAMIVALLVVVALIAAPAVSTASLSLALTVHAGLASGVGAVVLLVPSVFGSPSVGDDPIVVPLSGVPAPPARRWPDAVLRWWVPAVGLGMCALVWLLS